MSEDLLSAWIAEEEALLARQRAGAQAEGGGVGTREQFEGLTGLEALRRMIAGELPAPPIAYTMDFFLMEVEAGCAVFQGRPLFKHYNPLGGVHGGWYATVLDSALGCAVHTTMDVGERYTTLELKLNLLRAMQDGKPQRVRAIGRVRHRGRQTASAEADLVGPDGRLYAHASTTCLVFSGADR